jgi:prepilin-type N-terminal cleavage/methylation domain-containing protein
MRRRTLFTVKAMNRAKMRLMIGSPRAGFTLIELMIVMIIAAALMSVTIPSFTRLTSSRNAQNARDALVWMAARARGRAIERGQTFLLEIDPATERVWIVRRNTGAALATDTLEAVLFTGRHASTISTAANTRITVCYSPRGYAFSCSANSPGANVDVTFTHTDKSAVARIKPLGQIERI